jgi:predicted TIM-barrel fold metal-dependent hydrolase
MLEGTLMAEIIGHVNALFGRRDVIKGMFATSALLATACATTPSGTQQTASSAGPERRGIVDTHAHPVRHPRRQGMNEAAIVDAMNEYGIDLTLLMSPPLPPDRPGGRVGGELTSMARRHPGRLAFIGGGDSLNPMLQETPAGAIPPAVLTAFQREAEAIARSGAAAFGEMAAEHFSSGRGNHPYESTTPDHPLLLALADIAAREGMPIDLHMEAVPRDMPFPANRLGGPNPTHLRENISGLERLLAHNPNARIVWAHAGWDLTGERTVPLMHTLLDRHSNLYMNVKMDEQGNQRTEPFAPDGSIRSDWLALLGDFPDRFMVGSDQFYGEPLERLEFGRRFVDALPPEIAHRIASENARRIYRFQHTAGVVDMPSPSRAG